MKADGSAPRSLSDEWWDALIAFAGDAAAVEREKQHGDAVSLRIVMMAGTMGRDRLVAATRALMAEGVARVIQDEHCGERSHWPPQYAGKRIAAELLPDYEETNG